MRKFSSFLLGFTLVAVISLAAGGQLLAAQKPSKSKSSQKSDSSQNHDISQQVIRSYPAAKPVKIGMLVQLGGKNKKTPEVLAVSQKNITKAYGVVVRPNDATFALKQTSKSQQVYVASNGKFRVLVCDQNGPVRSGDYITVSSLAGIGMRAGTGQSIVVGKALGTFDGSHAIGQETLQDNSGAKKTVNIGYVNAAVAIAHNPLEQAKSPSYLPGFLVKASRSVANKHVDAARIYISLIVILVTMVIVGIVFYSGIRGSMISVGRNPLAKKAVLKNLIRVVLIGIIILIIGLIGVYLILKL
jgi:hypothetical protein